MRGDDIKVTVTHATKGFKSVEAGDFEWSAGAHLIRISMCDDPEGFDDRR
jgi:hypothetical protein